MTIPYWQRLLNEDSSDHQPKTSVFVSPVSGQVTIIKTNEPYKSLTKIMEEQDARKAQAEKMTHLQNKANQRNYEESFKNLYKGMKLFS